MAKKIKEETEEDRKKKAKQALSLIETASNYKQKDIVFKSTGILPLDLTMKNGGYMPGRFVETYGPEHSGKTLMALLAIIWDQKMFGNKSLFIDAEASFDVKWFKTLGGNTDLLDIYNPYKMHPEKLYGEYIFDNVYNLIQTQKYSYAVLDSLMGASLVTKNIILGDLDDTKKVGGSAGLNQQFFQKIFGKLVHRETTFIVTNHIRKKIGVMFGNPETTPGGDALKFYAEQRLRVGTPKEKTDMGHKVTGSIIKNKRGSSAGQAFDFYLSYSYGIDNYKEMRKELIAQDMIGKKDKIEINEKNYEDYRKQLLAIYNNMKLEGETEKSEVADNYGEELEVFE